MTFTPYPVNALNDIDKTPHRPLVAQWQFIPPEIWSTIFVTCLPSNPSHDFTAEEHLRDPRNIPVILASVCRTWRGIACNTGLLWATCWVNFVRTELNTLWLERSADCPLHIYGRHYQKNHDEYNWEPLLLSILPFQQRWKVFDMSIGDWGIMNLTPTFQTSELETFKIGEGFTIPVWLSGLLTSSPKLRNLAIDKFGLGTPTSVVSLDLPFLSTLYIDQCAIHDIILALPHLPRLEHLFVQYIDNNADPNSLPIITHTKLTSLGFGFDREITMPILFDHLILPSLQTLYNPFSFDPIAFLRLVDRSGCRLTSLKVGRNIVWDGGVVLALERNDILPWLECLDIPGVDKKSMPQLSKYLHMAVSHRLTRLTIVWADHWQEGIPDGNAADLIISLRKSSQLGRGLKHVVLKHLSARENLLDVARLTPLPGDRSMDHNHPYTSKDLEASLLIELDVVMRSTYVQDRWSQIPRLVKSSIKRCHVCREELEDDVLTVS